MVWKLSDSGYQKCISSTKFSMSDTKLYIWVVTLSSQGNANLLKQLKSINKNIKLILVFKD